MATREEKLRAIQEQIADSSSDVAYTCSRVWSAWSYGTMTEDDFVPVEADEEFLESLSEAILAKLEGLEES